MIAHARTCPGNHEEGPLRRLELGLAVPADLKEPLTRAARDALVKALGTPASEDQIPTCAAQQVEDAIRQFLSAGKHHEALGVQRRQDSIFVGDATEDKPEPAPGRYYPKK